MRFLLLGASLALTVMAVVSGADSLPGPRAVDPAWIDAAVAPCDDFYAFANGAFARVPLPPGRVYYGVDEEVDDRNFALLREILETAMRAGGAPGSIDQRLGDFYASGLDEAAIAAAGIAPLQPLLAAIDAIARPADLPAVLGRLHRTGIVAGFEFGVEIDDKDSTAIIVRLQQGGLGLPERSYYFDAAVNAARIRTAYVAFVARLLELLGEEKSAAVAAATSVVDLETRLATASHPLADLQDPQANYHRFPHAGLAAEVAALDWPAYFAAVELPPRATDVIVGQPDYFRALATEIVNTPLNTWRAYLRARVLAAVAFALGPEFVEARFEFWGRTVAGAREMQPRWKRVLMATNAALGDDLGRRYVQRAFPAEAKVRVTAMVRHTIAAMRGRITRATWMSEATRAAAIQKLDTTTFKIGYPERWRDYDSLTVVREPYVTNILAAWAHAFQHELGRLSRPVDREEWHTSPQTNNAYYNFSLNQMLFPAGALQPPLFDVHADDASNYGAIGSLIGHELSHAFDSHGRQYDAGGNLRDWWAGDDAAQFESRAALVAQQYANYEAAPGLRVDGRLTLGENIADIGGLLVAYDAFRLATSTAPATPPPVDGYTPAQRFFIAFAQRWRANMTPEILDAVVRTDTHSPVRFRVNGTVANVPDFYDAFGCAAPATLAPPIW